MNRPARPQRQSNLLQVRVTPGLMAAISRAAQQRNLTMADYIRSVIAEAIYGPTLPASKGKARKGGQ